MLDAGRVWIYQQENAALRGGAPMLREGALKLVACYGERTVGMQRFFAGRQANVRVDRMIRVWRDRAISTQDVAVIDGERYSIVQVQEVQDGDEMPVMDLSLERVVSKA